SLPNALLVTATIQNDAPWPQAWPLLELTLSDLDGNPVALRRFTAAEYLGGPPEAPTLAPGQSALARLEIADPGNRAVAFNFEFRCAPAGPPTAGCCAVRYVGARLRGRPELHSRSGWLPPDRPSDPD